MEMFKYLGQLSNNNIFYTPSDIARKNTFWDEARVIKETYGPSLWCFPGDFNVISYNFIEVHTFGL